MKKSKFTEEQIVFALRQAESGTPIVGIVRKREISEVTLYRWKKKYSGMRVSQRDLEAVRNGLAYLKSC